MHPYLQTGVELGTFELEDSDQTYYYAKNKDGKNFLLTRPVWEALLKANGTAPLDLPDKGKNMIPLLKKRDLIHTSRFARNEKPYSRFIVFVFSDRRRPNAKLFRAIDFLLSWLCPLVFALGVTFFLFVGNVGRQNLNLLLVVLNLFASLVLHEAGHLIAGLAYKFKVTDAGFLLQWFFPVGAYVACDETPSASTRARLRLSLSGVEMNLLLAGILYCLASLGGPLAATILCLARMNVLVILSNLIPVYGLDGESILSTLCGVKSIFQLARKKLLNPKSRKKLLRSGLCGICAFLFLGTILLSRVWSFLLLLISVLAMFCGII